jgi:carbamoyltransferase
LGPAYDEDEVQRVLERAKLAYQRPPDMAEAVAEKLARDQIVGWFQGRMEFGPRALGARSILASPLDAAMRDRLNEIKDREDFRPVAPMVPEEDAAEWFSAAEDSPFMLFVHDVLPGKEDLIPAVRHIDGTARIQTVRRQDAPLVHALLNAFARLTGVPVLVNTSFNTLGQPIVCSPRDALECFWTSPMDALAIGPFLIEKPAPAEG